jgi:hypothetical protein
MLDPDYRPEYDPEELAYLEDYYDGIAERLIEEHEQKMKKIDKEAAGAAELEEDQ